MSAPEVETWSADGIGGPPASDCDVRGKRVDLRRGEHDGLARLLARPAPCAGIRPVLTWKSTAAAPTPIRLGPLTVPCASRPWQLEQFWPNSALPALIWACGPPAGEAPDAAPPVTAE